MMVKIFLDPGHGGNDPGAVGNGLQEKNLTLQLSQLIRDMLVDEYNGVDVRMSRTNDTFVSLSNRSQLANQWAADYFVSIHVNAGGGTGFESFVHSSRAQQTVNLQNIIHDQIMERLNVVNRGKKSANFAVLRQTAMPAILTENLFIDNTRDAENLRNPAFLRQVARGHVNGLEEAFNLQKKNNAPNPDVLYKVQSGAFRNPQNANALRLSLEQEGYQPFVRFESSFYRVQVGAFSNKANADALAEELKNKGFDAIVIQA